MKTTFKKYMLALALSPMLLSSCSDSFLDEVNPNEQTPATFWVNQDNAEKGLAAVYNQYRRMTWGYYGAHESIFHYSMRADDLYPTRGEELTLWQTISFINTPITKNDMWGHIYRGIQLANEFLYYAPNVPMDKGLLDQMLGEAYFLRGFWYFRLRCDYNEGVIRTLPQTEDSQTHGLSKPEEVLAQAISDFQEAAKRLPATRTGDESGRVTKGAAEAMLGKALVWKGDYAGAKTTLESVMKNYGYGLTEKYEDNFRNDTEFNKESIFELNFAALGNANDRWGSTDSDNSFMGTTLGNFFGPCLPKNGGWYKMQPSPYLVHQFVAEKRPDGSDSKWDKRLYTTCFFKYSDFGDVKKDETFFDNFTFDQMFETTTNPGGQDKYRIAKVGSAPEYPIIEGVQGRFLMKKLCPWWNKGGCSMYGGNSSTPGRITNFRIMRFAEVLFLHAEACLQVGDEATAMNDINRIRVRAGLAEKHLSGKDAIMEELRNQKLLEFAGENVRWDDLVRWYSYEELKSILLKRKVDSGFWIKKVEGDKATYVHDPASFFPGGKLDDTQNIRLFEKKHMYFPIPQHEVDANKDIEQKAEWR